MYLCYVVQILIYSYNIITYYNFTYIVLIKLFVQICCVKGTCYIGNIRIIYLYIIELISKKYYKLNGGP